MDKRCLFIYCIMVIVSTMPFVTSAQKHNTLTEQEKRQGWQLLFNGENLTGWHSYLSDGPGKAWQVNEGMIILNKTDKSQYDDYADLITDKEYTDFDLKLDWKIEPCGNSGVMIYVCESDQYANTYETGPEMQITDLACSPDSRRLYRRAGALYDLIPVDTEWVSKGGLWNHYEIISDHGHLQLFMNGHKVVDTRLWNMHWKQLIAASKFATMPGFGTFHKGHIALQGTENGKLWFRNIKIKEL